MSATPCDIVLTDWQMPNMDGISLCKHVRLEHQDDSVYVLLLTVRDTEEDRLAGIAAEPMITSSKEAQPMNFWSASAQDDASPQARLSSRNWDREHGHLSITDPLTNARNLRFFTQQLPRAIARARRDRHALAVLSCRIDGFEEANDRFGYDVGDEALRAFVADSRSCIRRMSTGLLAWGWIGS